MTTVKGKKEKKCFLKWNDFNETAQSVQQYHVFYLNEVVKQDLCLHILLCSYQSNQKLTHCFFNSKVISKC